MKAVSKKELRRRRAKVKQVLVCALILVFVACVFPSVDKPVTTIPGMKYFGFPFYYVSFFMLVPAGFLIKSFITDFVVWAVASCFIVKHLVD